MVPSGHLAQETTLELVDGRKLHGIAVRRDGGVFILTLESRTELAFPVELVRAVHVGDSDPPSTAPTGMRVAEPETLAGPTISAPRTEDQLAVLGKPATFQKGVIDSRWTPSTDWNMDPHTQNNFNPSTWSQSPIDPTWEPTSAFDANKDVLAKSRSKFRPSIIDSTWTPTDAFAD
ncbi:MAG: hypothetical protein OES25_03710 [Acidobacteriota bacterium]|nr:hypothetical protein [Acidobacteriota bacterium]